MSFASAFSAMPASFGGISFDKIGHMGALDRKTRQHLKVRSGCMAVLGRAKRGWLVSMCTGP